MKGRALAEDLEATPVPKRGWPTAADRGPPELRMSTYRDNVVFYIEGTGSPVD